MLLIADDYGQLLEVICVERELPRIQELEREEAGWACMMLMWELQGYADSLGYKVTEYDEVLVDFKKFGRIHIRGVRVPSEGSGEKEDYLKFKMLVRDLNEK